MSTGTMVFASHTAFARGGQPEVGLFAAAAGMCLAGAGAITNDLQDLKIDQIAHPNRPLPTGVISRQAALLFAAVLYSLSLVFAALAGIQALFAVLTWCMVLMAYSRAKSRFGLLGNFIAATLVSFLMLIGSITAKAPLITEPQLVALASLAFVIMVSREMLGDVTDIDGDAARKRTLPLWIGAQRTTLVAAILLVFASGIAGLVSFHQQSLGLRIVGLATFAVCLSCSALLVKLNLKAVRPTIGLLKGVIILGAIGLLIYPFL